MWTVLQNVLRMRRADDGPTPVLIVDDEEAVLRLIDRVLRGAGYATTTAKDGTEAIEAAGKIANLGVIVTDLMMPKMNGDELARRLRVVQPDLKVLYLTGYSDRLFAEKTTLWRDEAYLDKPFTSRGLQEAVSLLLKGHVEAAPAPEAVAAPAPQAA